MSVTGDSFSRKKLIVFFLVLALVLFAVAAQDFSPVSGIPHLFYGRILGCLDCYFLEDYSAPSASFCYAVKAGTSIQSAETTGFSELYARLFFSPAGGQQAFYDNGAFSVSTECTGDCAIYSATFSADCISDILSLLAECVTADGFPEDELWTQYQAMRRKASEWDASSESYINGAMDAKMFPEYPWSRETGLYADSFNGYWVDRAASILDEMRWTYYVPENAAFFLCGPFAPEEVFNFLLSLAPDGASAAVADNTRVVDCGVAVNSAQTVGFGSAPVSNNARLTSSAPVAYKETSDFGLATIASSGEGGRYVLVSDGFSKEFNQISIQYVLPATFLTAGGVVDIAAGVASDAETAVGANASVAGAAAGANAGTASVAGATASANAGATGVAEVAAAETAAAILQNGSAFKSLVLKDETCGIKSADWLYASFSRQQSGSRLIFQALMENDGTSQTPGTQALAFSRCIENDNLFPADEVAYFSAITADRLSLLRRDSFQLIHALAEDWAFCTPVFPELNRVLVSEGFTAFSYRMDFAEQFTASYASAARSLSAAELSRVLDSEPYIFLLLNTDVYKANKTSLEKEGFVFIPQDKGIWYKTGEYKTDSNSGNTDGVRVAEFSGTASDSGKQSFAMHAAEKLASVLAAKLKPSETITQSYSPAPETGLSVPKVAQSESLELLAAKIQTDANISNGITNYIAHGKAATMQKTLSNGIPVLVQDGTTSSFSFQIQFSGKIEGFSSSERDMRTVISDVIANNIRQYILYSGAVPYTGFSVTPECTLYGSSVVVSTTTEYAEPVISLTAEALFFGELSAPRIDESAYSRSSEWSMNRADGDFQLRSAAFARLYQGTVGADYFDLKGDFFANITFQDMEMEYLSMLDANCISISMCGENASDYVSIVENCFGFLRGFSSSCRDSAVSALRTRFPDESVPVTLRRIFTSSVKPGEYVEQPAKLIPTEVFYDPLHIYFECPAYDSPEYAVFVALVYELADILDGMWEPGVLPSVDMLYAPIAGVWFHGVTESASVYATFAKGVERLNEPFDEARLKKIRERYVEKFCSAQASSQASANAAQAAVNASRLLESRFYGGGVEDGEITAYLSQLERLQNATAEDFAEVAARFRTLPLLRSVSADTK